MSEDYIARLMAAKALKNGGGEQGDFYSKAEVDEKLSEKANVEDLSNYATTQTLTEELAKKADKTELDVCVKQHTLQNTDVDFDNLTTAGFYRLGKNNTNGPTGDVITDGNAMVVRSGNSDNLAQLVFPYFKYTGFSYRAGTTIDGNQKLGKQPWLYFHGSTSPNIPVLKKKIINDTTNSVGGLSFGFKINDAIVLAVYMNSCEKVTTAYPEVYNNYSSGSTTVGVRIINYNTNEVVSNTNVSLIVYYLEIPQDYEFPDTTQASDEPEDDIGILQTAEAEQEFPHAEE